MFIGQGAAGKTSTVRSLLAQTPVATHESTVGVSLQQTRARDWQRREMGESDFDLLAQRAAARRVAPKPKPSKRASLSRAVRKSVPKGVRKSVSKRLSKPKKEEEDVLAAKRRRRRCWRRRRSRSASTLRRSGTR